MDDNITFTGWRKSRRSFSNGGCAEVATWRKSSRSEAGNCLEAGNCSRGVAVRDTKMGLSSPVLTFSGQTWRRFLGRVRAGAEVLT